jgi:hypothetical protein
MGVWQGVAVDSLKLHLGPPCLTLLHPAGRPSLKRPHGHFRYAPPAGRVACCRLLPSWTVWTPHVGWLVGLPVSISQVSRELEEAAQGVEDGEEG